MMDSNRLQKIQKIRARVRANTGTTTPSVGKKATSNLTSVNKEKLKRHAIRTKGKRFITTNKMKDCLGGVYKFFIAEADQYRTWKMFLGFPFGALLGYGLFRLVISPMELPEVTRQFLGAVLIFGIAASFALFVGARCVCFLLIPTFMGAAGRSYIGTFAIFFLLQGPIENIVNNTQEITRTLACSAELSANQTMTKWQFRFAPIGNVFKDMQAEGFMLKNVGTRVNRAFSNVRAQIENKKDNAKVQAGKTIVVREEGTRRRTMDMATFRPAPATKKEDRTAKHKYRERKVDPDAQRIENEYKEKVKKQCEDVHDQGVHACWRVFENIYRRCLECTALAY
ncbi:hypothetical protein DPMN_170415 [Dreissena polymorpha]|uniref:Uncharacterized protein n=1 Tax=Dreissena polymorpha TaxID=45954 RepID=A0A9D4DYC3_DREPO|nr:hypothetical protein DPMN_170415 [Dreissena polymorpha]